eukprot:CCRYP_011099-RA/>CCRYP_011099-RA protein AED:0.48 eAED:0.47 QI:0/-1/0/1/-1/0/1/0/104
MSSFLKGIDPSLRSPFTLVNKNTVRISPGDARVPISKPPWSPPGPNMPSNVAISPTHGRNGTAAWIWKRRGPTGRLIGHEPSKKTVTSAISRRHLSTPSPCSHR